MGNINSNRKIILVAFSLSLMIFLSACDSKGKFLKRPSMTTLSPRLALVFEKTKSVCFGHFMIDVPITAITVFGPTNIDSPIVFRPGESRNIEQSINNQLAKVEKDRKFLDKDDTVKFTLFGKVVDGLMPGQKLVFGSEDRSGYAIYSFIPIGEDLFFQRSSSVLVEDDILSAEITSLNMVASHLRLRTEDEAPTEPGACIEGGFVAWQPEFERVALGVRLKEFPDVHFSIDATKKNVLVESDALEPRLKQAEEYAQKHGLGAAYARIKTLRRGPRQLGDWNGFEILAHKPAYENDTEAHEFLFMSHGVPKDPLRPVLDIQLNTGVKDNLTANAKPSLSDEEAVALWDKLTSSIRIRPTGTAKSAAPPQATQTAPERLPLGELVRTGVSCPQTGYWQCVENDVQGNIRLFNYGETMPPASVKGNLSLFDRLKGISGLHHIDTVWRLARYG